LEAESPIRPTVGIQGFVRLVNEQNEVGFAAAVDMLRQDNRMPLR